ncbi:MAG: DUF6152 family protein [Gammaproteobacteria bacterium]
MSRSRRAVIAAVLLGVIGMRSGLAHHSYAMFDMSRPSDVTGTVHSLEWTNPHVWLWVSVTDEKGVSVLYAFEGSSIGEMLRAHGWSKSSVKPGDKVAVKYFPFKDGKTGGRLERVTLPDGRTISG